MKNIFTKIATGAVTSTALSVAIAVDVPTASAASLFIANHGFEETILEEGGYTYREPIPGWQIYDPNNLFANGNSNYSVFNAVEASYPGGIVAEGNNVGAIFLANEVGSGVAGFSQILGDVLTAGKAYTLKVNIGDPFPDEYTGEGFPGYAVQLLAGGQVIAEDFNTQSFNPGTFITSTVSYTASANDNYLGQALEIRLLNVLTGTGKEVNFDNVRLDATSVPEPTSIFGLLGLGAFGAVSAFKKKRTSSQRG
ncbi:MAG TPA: PEP-CTERM sorting domain-containing protein [Leptolyngbyaceae cyanobacterium]